MCIYHRRVGGWIFNEHEPASANLDTDIIALVRVGSISFPMMTPAGVRICSIDRHCFRMILALMERAFIFVQCIFPNIKLNTSRSLNNWRGWLLTFAFNAKSCELSHKSPFFYIFLLECFEFWFSLVKKRISVNDVV